MSTQRLDVVSNVARILRTLCGKYLLFLDVLYLGCHLCTGRIDLGPPNCRDPADSPLQGASRSPVISYFLSFITPQPISGFREHDREFHGEEPPPDRGTQISPTELKTRSPLRSYTRSIFRCLSRYPLYILIQVLSCIEETCAARNGFRAFSRSGHATSCDVSE